MGILIRVISIAVLVAVLHVLAQEEYTPREYPPYDGWYNNFARPDWGAAETGMIRKVPPAYSDGSFEPSGALRPNPMELSMAVFTGSTGQPSYFSRSAFFVYFGQQVVEEIMDAQRPNCPPEYFNIPIPEGHVHYDNVTPVNVMPLLRIRYDQRTGYSPNNPRNQLNEITSFIDGTLVYGPNRAWTDAIRQFKDGRLLADEVTLPYDEVNDGIRGTFPVNNSIRLPFANPPTPREHKLKEIKRFNRLGNPRGNENPFLLTMGVLWFRYHNYWAKRLSEEHPTWGDEALFNEARKMTIGVYQKIVMYDWLPIFLQSADNPDLDGIVSVYEGYDPSIHPGMAHVTSTAAMRFGHTLVTPGGFRRNKDCEYRNTTSATAFPGKMAVRTCNAYWNSQEAVYETDIDELIMGLSSQICEREDNTITPDLRGDVFGPLEFSRRDLMAINIQRGRDHGLPDFNTVRKGFGLDPITEWYQLIKNPDMNNSGIIERLRELHNNSLDDLDLWVGGMVETNEGPGETFTRIILDQFYRIRNGDRFWYENRLNGLYTEEERDLINNITLLDVITNVTNISPSDIQENPFTVPDPEDFIINGRNCTQPVQLSAENKDHVEACTGPETFDYFSGSEISYALSLVALFLTFFICLGVLFCLAKRHNRMVEKERSKLRAKTRKEKGDSGGATSMSDSSFHTASEWQGKKEKWRNIKIKLDKRKKHVEVKDESGKLLRTVDFIYMAKQRQTIDMYLSADRNMTMIVIQLPKEYDMVFKFDHVSERQEFLDRFKDFLDGEPAMTSPKAQSEKQMFNLATTKEDRKKQLENFFRAVFSHMAKDEDDWGDLSMTPATKREVLHSELTKYEFAEALGLKATSSFVDSMFKMIDEDDSGAVSFKEFVDLIVVFYKGDADRKMQLLFNMYDLDRSGTLSKDEFKDMLKSLVELSNTQIEEDKIEELIRSLCSNAKVDKKNELTFDDFSTILRDYKSELNYAMLDFNLDGVQIPKTIKRDNAPIRARKTLYRTYSVDSDRKKRMSTLPQSEIKTVQRDFPDTPGKKRWNAVKRYIENYKLHIFWVTLYTLVCIGIFVERGYYYSVEREHAGLRRIAGDGVTITRGAASGMMFTYASLLVTMCRNIITKLRETFLHRYVPFDAAVAFHKYISVIALLFTLMHIIGHCINFYHVATQTANDLNCLFRNYFHATHVLPKLHYWLWETITGFTGVLLTVQFFLIYIFAMQYARRHSFRSFWITHNSYVIFFILMILHGAGRLVQPAFTHYFFLGPIILFTIDQLISVSRKKVEISVVKAELLPSDVTFLEFTKPANFEYKSGQWMRLACVEQGREEYHPFTISSAPHEENLSLHIRAVGPWTYALRRTYNKEHVKGHSWPKVLIDGPYGEGHQDWYRFEVAVLVGGGIGVTPFTSILKDIAHRSKMGAKITCKKIYFLWVTRTQKQFEWVTDIIREVEDNDNKDLVSVHIFITQFKQKFDIRTTMLYICERYFQKISERSLFTGLRSITHFGRPDFESFLEMLSAEHGETNVFGVFSCGPPPMTNNVERACQTINNKTANVLFVHHYENF